MNEGLGFASQDRRVPSFKNKLINGGFDIWQRGEIFTASFGLYSADRWKQNGAYIEKRTNADGTSGLQMSESGTFKGIIQTIEDGNGLKGKSVTVSIDVSSMITTYLGVQLRIIQQVDGTTVDWVVLVEKNDASVGLNVFNFTIPDTAGSHYLEVNVGGVGSVSETFNTKMNYIQLEEGSRATAFEQRPIGLELALCQRYYSTASTHNRSRATGGDIIRSSVYFKNSMRIIPTVVMIDDASSPHTSPHVLKLTNQKLAFGATMTNTGVQSLSYDFKLDAEL